ncbi:MAG: phasin family protein [Pseudomonadota bacterium]
MEAQLSFFSDMSKSLFRSIQQLGMLNFQMVQTMAQESTRAGHCMLSDRQSEVISATASHAQPMAETLRSYNQHLSRIAADSQVELAKVAEEHVRETSRTAQSLANEVRRAADEEMEKNRRTQEEALKQFTDPFRHLGNGHAREDMGAQAAMPGQAASRQQQPGGARKEA